MEAHLATCLPLHDDGQTPVSQVAHYAWALLLARIYEVFPLICPKCGGETKIIAFTIEGEAVREIKVDFGWQVQRYVIECGWISYP